MIGKKDCYVKITTRWPYSPNELDMIEEKNEIESVHAVYTGICCRGHRVMLELEQPRLHKKAASKLKRSIEDAIDEMNGLLRS